MSGSRGRLVRTVAVGCVAVVVVVVVINWPPSSDKGHIFFGRSLVHTKLRTELAGQTAVFRSSDHTMALTANLTRPKDISFGLLRDLFQVRIGGRWSNVAWIDVRAPKPGGTVYIDQYSLRYLAKQGVKAPGYYRLIILGNWIHQAVGTFRLIR